MSTQALDGLNAENPWPGLRQFDELDKDFFNGRELETTKLLHLVNNAPLTVLFGCSGLGKTSLLLAGLAPRLRAQNKLPIYVRLNPLDRRRPIIEQAFDKFREELEAREVDYPPFQLGESLWEYLHRVDLELWSKVNQLLTPVFILDQFEEVFTVGSANREAVERLREDLADLVENLVPTLVAKKYDQVESLVPTSVAKQYDQPASAATLIDLHARRSKVLLSFREDFLAEAESWRSAIPLFTRNRLRLEPMNGNQAKDAVIKTGGGLIDDATGREIVKFVAAARAELRGNDWDFEGAPTGETVDLSQLEIEPALLSLVCTKLNERRKEAHKTKIDQSLLSGTTKIVEEFYKECVRDLPDRVGAFIENELITESGGFRNAYSRQDTLARGDLSDDELETLVNRRLLRVEQHLGEPRIELIHDVLAPVVRKFRDARRASEEVARKRKEKRHKNIRFWQRVMFASLFVGVIAFWTNVARNSRLQNGDAKHKEALKLAHKGDYQKALTALSDALSTFEMLRGDWSAIIRARVDRGKIYALIQQNDAALQDLSRALKEATALPPISAEEALALESLASFHEGVNEKSTAIEEYDRALSKYKELEDLPSIARILEWKASVEEEEQKFEIANENYEQARTYYQISGDTIGMTRTDEAIKRTVTWGYLVDLRRGTVNTTHGSRFTIGRDVPEEDIKNDLSFSNSVVSRRHLEIAQKLSDGQRTFQIEDFRSLNGSTVNAAMLRYAHREELRNGDIITLANSQVLRFTTTKPESTSVPANAWAIFIDGSSRKYFYLTDGAYSIVKTSSGLMVEKDSRGSELLKLRNEGNNKLPEVSVDNRWSACVTGKMGDYKYGQKYLTRDQYRHIFYFSAHLVPKPADLKQPCEGLPFHIVLLSENEPR